jgi:hypothetical protein
MILRLLLVLSPFVSVVGIFALVAEVSFGAQLSVAIHHLHHKPRRLAPVSAANWRPARPLRRGDGAAGRRDAPMGVMSGDTRQRQRR